MDPFCKLLNCRIQSIVLLLFFAPLFGEQVRANDWEDQSIFRINKEEPHATKMPFLDSQSARTKKRLESSYAQVLNGDWKYQWSPDPDHRPKDFYKTDFDDSKWETIPVPANVELEGHGTPIYTNMEYPFKKDAPRVMGEPPKDWTGYKARNPISSYRRSFTVPANWKERNTFVVFNGVESAFYLWCNGQKVGYSQDSRTPAEFDLTPYLVEGENSIAVEVYRYSDGSYLEDQDFWRLSGIFRDVYLWSAASLDIRDFQINAGLDDQYEKGRLTVKTWTTNYLDGKADYSIHAELLDGEKTVADLQLSGTTQGDEEDIQFASTENLDIEHWSAESPRLYDLLITLKDAQDKPVAFYSRKVGFRTSEIKNGNLLVNGKPILVKGVNRHDHHHITGHYISEESMLEDLDQMKRLNVNAIRTSHYPNDPRFLELCDEYGFYVVSEANIETHGYGRDRNPIPKDMSWLPAHLDRNRNNIELNKNHASAIIWSMGNEAGDGPVFANILDWIHERDPSRPVQYENALFSRHVPKTPVEIYAPMYYFSRDMRKQVELEMKRPAAERRPFIQCEYSHAMGNSCGGFSDYWDLYRELPLAQGGFIWDWRDQGLLRTAETTGEAESKEYFAYGGDYGDKPNSNNFCMNGVVASDTSLNPHAHEVYYQYRSILTTLSDDSSSEQVTLNVLNENFFKDVLGTKYRWTLLEGGQSVASGEGQLPSIAPQQTEAINIQPKYESDPNKEYVLTIEFLQGADKPWAKSDHVTAWDQFVLPWGERTVVAHSTTSTFSAEPTDEAGKLTISGDSFQVVFDQTNGQMTSYQWDGGEMLEGPLRLNFWRPQTDNDRGYGMQGNLGVWHSAGDKVKTVSKSVEKSDNSYKVTYELAVPAKATKATLEYLVHGDGVIEVSVEVDPTAEDLPSIPRIGMQCQISKSFDQWSWYGRGPWENYIDRNTGAPLGVYSDKVENLWHNYTETQENSNRTGIRWATFLNSSQEGLRIESNDSQTLEIGAYPFDQGDFNWEHRGVDLVEKDYVTVHIAHKQMGIGGENSWGAKPLDHYQLPANQVYKYQFRLLPSQK